jgi:L-amino acid N-acyltransferase YncA
MSQPTGQPDAAAASIRPATVSDAPALAAIYLPYVTETSVSFEQHPPDASEMARRMTAAPGLPWLVAEVDGVIAGYAYASPHRLRHAYRWSADCSVYLSAGFTAVGAVDDSIPHCSANCENWARSTCSPASPNRIRRR